MPRPTVAVAALIGGIDTLKTLLDIALNQSTEVDLHVTPDTSAGSGR